LFEVRAAVAKGVVRSGAKVISDVVAQKAHHFGPAAAGHHRVLDEGDFIVFGQARHQAQALHLLQQRARAGWRMRVDALQISFFVTYRTPGGGSRMSSSPHSRPSWLGPIRPNLPWARSVGC
jgi:hypothetical protein